MRGERWHVVETRAFEACRLLTLTSAEPGRRGETRRVLTPFDDVEVLRARTRPIVVGWRRWRRACRALLASETPPGGLRAARRASIDVLPHQLEPALAILRGLGSRVLLADDVGLGKTIQAGLVVSELIARACVDRVLVVTPAGVRDQWAGELLGRFGIDAARADAHSLRDAASRLPIGVNPWTTLPIAIVSLDYMKRPEVLPAVAACRWDLLIVDEAHAAAGRSDRQSAIQVVARQAAYVLLSTATPHSGDVSAFDALCRVGATAAATDDPLIVFRRTRREIRGEAIRRTHTLHVRSTALEQHMLTALAAYQRAARAEHGARSVALSVLDKRAFSSAWSLAQSVARRIDALAALSRPEDIQLSLPLEDPEGELTAEDEAPPWPAGLELGDRRRELRLLASLLELARAAVRSNESKIRALRRLLRRAREPLLVFTEYRDTALHLQAAIGGSVLHGGLSRDDRAVVLERFSRGAARLLISTDAAGQGLNLQHAARIVVNLELPWNPMRLEQRIGRVDRIGQRRRVHVFHLVGADTGETRVLERLKDRIGAAQACIEAPNPLDVGTATAARSSGPAGNDDAQRRYPVLSSDARSEAQRLTQARALDADADSPMSIHAPWIARARRWKLRAALAGRAIFLVELRAEDASGTVVETSLFPIAASLRRTEAPRHDPQLWQDVFDVAQGFSPAKDAIERWRRTVTAVRQPFWSRRLARERAIAAPAAAAAVLFQPALFDRRAERDAAVKHAAGASAHRDAAERLVRLGRQSTIVSTTFDLRLIVLP